MEQEQKIRIYRHYVDNLNEFALRQALMQFLSFPETREYMENAANEEWKAHTFPR